MRRWILLTSILWLFAETGLAQLKLRPELQILQPVYTFPAGFARTIVDKNNYLPQISISALIDYKKVQFISGLGYLNGRHSVVYSIYNNNIDNGEEWTHQSLRFYLAFKHNIVKISDVFSLFYRVQIGLPLITNYDFTLYHHYEMNYKDSIWFFQRNSWQYYDAHLIIGTDIFTKTLTFGISLGYGFHAHYLPTLEKVDYTRSRIFLGVALTLN